MKTENVKQNKSIVRDKKNDDAVCCSLPDSPCCLCKRATLYYENLNNFNTEYYFSPLVGGSFWDKH